MSSTQLNRLSYTKRDLELIDQEVSDYITHFIPAIKNAGKANVGRLLLRIVEALIDKANYSIDMKFRQSMLRTVQDLQSAIDISEIVRYPVVGSFSSHADLVATTLTGPAPIGGIPIPQYTLFTTSYSPIKQFLSTESVTIPAGASSYSPIPVVEGKRITGQVIRASSLGSPNEEITLPVPKTPTSYLEILVDGNPWSIVQDLRISLYNDLHVMTRVDASGYTTLIFGDGEYGSKLSVGSSITANYIQCSGESGNTSSGRINKVIGSLSSQIAVTNPEASSGGSDGDTVEDIVRKAPLQSAAFYRASRDEDFKAIAESVPGVYQALVSDGVGSVVDVYILPNGGGVASSQLISDVSEELSTRVIHGAFVNVNALLSAHVLIKMQVVLQSNSVNKALARKKIYEAISAVNLDGSVNASGALYYRNIKVGRGFTLSDIAYVVEGVDSGSLVDWVNFSVVTRYPTPISGNPLTTVSFISEITPGSAADYSSWVVQAITTTTFYVYKNGVYDSSGSIGSTFTSSDGSISFTLGLTTDVFTTDDVWTFITSSYRNNIKLSNYEFMELVRDSDLDIQVYYPGELEIGDVNG